MATIGTLRIAPSGCLGLPFFSPDIPEPGHFLFFFPYFLWAHRSGYSSPLPPTRLLLSLTVHSRGLGRFGPCEPNFLSRGGLHLRRSLFNKICDSSWLRYVDGVTSLDLDDRSTRALGHGTLRVRWNHLVLGGDQVPARLGPPRGFADRAANGPHAPRNLGISHERGFFRVHVGCERGRKLRPVEEQKAVLRRQYRRYGRAGRRVLNKRSH